MRTNILAFALGFTGASYYFYQKQRDKIVRDRNLLFINSGLLIFGLPFSQLADYMDVFRFFGGTLALSGLFLLVYSVKLPKLSVSSMLFAIVIGGFLVNQYLMWQRTKGGKVSVSTSPMKLTPFDVVLAKERMDKNGDGICDVCGMSLDQCITSGQLDCNMGNQKDAIGVLGSQHIHADFKVFVHGRPVDFSDKDHMGRQRANLPVSSFIHVDSGSPAPEKTGDVLHMHATNVPLWLFFKSIGMKFDNDNEGGNTFRFYLNGKKVDDLSNYVFQDLDKILIRSGPENDPDIERQLNSITDFAKNH